MIVAKLKKCLPLAISFLLLVVFLFLQISCIFRESRTYDEILHLEAGLKFWKEKDFTIEPFNPPLARELVSLPMLMDQGIIKDPFLFYPRIITVIFSLFLGVLVYLFSKDIFGKWPAVFSLIIFIFTPEILGHGHYANTDLISTFFSFFSLYIFNKFFLRRKEILWRHYCLLGLTIGLSLATKTTAVFFTVLPIMVCFSITKIKINLKFALLLIGITLIAVWSTYFFTLEPVLGYRADPNRQALSFTAKYPSLSFLIKTPIPLGSYLSTLKQDLLSSQTNKFPKDTVFLGKLTQGVPGIYIWMLFLIKTPIPILLFLIFSIFKKAENKGVSFLKSAIILIFLQAVILGANLRLRYFLIIYPIAAVLLGNIFVEFWKKRQRWAKIMTGVMIVWLTAGTLRAYPHFLTYFNEFIGGRNNGYKYAVDSNLDWGQGLPTLQKYLSNKNIKDVQLAYFGSVEPSAYGISYLRIKDANLRAEKKVMDLDYNKPIVISASCWYYCGYFKKDRLKSLTPKVLSGQFLLFNF